MEAEQRAFDRIEQALADREQRPRLTALLEKRLDGFEKNFRQRLFIFDSVLLIISAVSSYFLSGKTLEPIAKMVKEQEDFAADASHELRTPLTTIGMEIEAQLRTEKIPPRFRRTLISIKEETGRMGKIVDGLLRLVRTEAGRGQVLARTFDLAELASDVVGRMRPLADNKNISIHLQADKKTMVRADREQIKQLGIILLDNAIKYTKSGGKISLSVEKKKNSALMQVSDTGMGIAPSDLPNIFRRFWRGRADAGSKTKGIGLGLPIAKQIAENHHGKLSVASELGKGSTFTLSLPVNS